MMKIFKKIGSFFYAFFMVMLIILVQLGPKTDKSRRKVLKKLHRKYPDYHVADLDMRYTDWSSTVRTADEDHKATSAAAVIEKDDRQRTIHLQRGFLGIWRIEKDSPDKGPDVPDDVYFVEKSSVTAKNKAGIEKCVSRDWVMPDEDGNLYHMAGKGNLRCYVCMYITNFYKTQNGRVYVLNKETFEWEPSQLLYSYLDYYGNFDPISKEKAEKIIKDRKDKMN